MENTKRKINLVLLVDCIKDLEGGAERQIFELSKRLNKERFAVTIVSLECESEAPRGLIESVGCRLVTYSVKRIYGLSEILKAFSFARFLKREKIDILMTYHFGSDIWGTVCGRMAGVRAVISNRRDVGFWRERRHVWAYKKVNRWVKKIIVNAQAVKKMVMDEEGVPEEKIEVIYNGIEVKDTHASGAASLRHKTSAKIRDFGGQEHPSASLRAGKSARLRQEIGIGKDDTVIAHVANLRPVKGHKFLIEAIAGVVGKAPNVKLILIGEGELKNELENQSTQLGIKDHVLFLGKRKDVRELLEIADICVLSSLSEGMSNAIMEYMASGKPVVATKVGGNPELVKDGVTGLLVEKENPESLKKALLDLVGHKNKRITMGEKAFQEVSRKFAMPRMVRNYENVFELFVFRKWKIFHLISSSGLFGAERIVLTLGRNIQDKNYTSIVGVLADTRQGGSKGELIEEAEESGIRTFPVKCHGRFDIGAVFRLKKYLLRERIDILHTHNYKSDIIGALAARMAGIPVIATAHGFTDMTRSVSFYERLDRWFLKHLFKKVVTVTDKILSDLPSEKRSVIPNGIDMEKFKRNDEKGKALRNEHNIGEADILIGTVGRLSKEKNQKMLLEAVYPLMRDDERVKVMLVGAGLKEWELKQFAQARHLTDRIIFTGIIKDTIAPYSAMDIFVLSSLTEGVPLTVLEAMACQIPVVATKVGGIPEMINDEETGLLVDPQDSNALKTKINMLIKDQDKCKRMAGLAYEYVRINYSLDRMCDAYREVYEEVLR